MSNYYVRDGGSGSGTSWSDAYDQLSSAEAVASRGDTIYVADGTYAGLTFNTAASGTQTITIKKATVADHGTNTGWSDAYGDGVAEFTSEIEFTTNYWNFDGQVGSGASGHGFKITTTDTGASKLITVSGGAAYITVEHAEFEHRGEDQNANQDCAYLNSSGSTNITFRNCYFHDVSRVHVYIGGITNSLFEHCVFKNRHETNTDIHGEAFSINNCGLNSGNVIRYCHFENIDGTGCIVIKDSVQSGFEIYGNTFTVTGTQSRYTWSNDMITNTGGDTTTGVKFHHNTIYNVQQGNTGIQWENGDSTNEAYNNIWYGCNAPTFTGVVHDYNASEDDLGETHDQTLSGDPFTNSAGGDFTLSANTDAGTALSATFNTDAAGNTRTTWSRGAFEYETGGDPGATKRVCGFMLTPVYS